jgi:chemotaxis response regulator CheB
MSQRVLIVDDHAVVRAGVRTFLSSYPDWEICGEAKDGEEAIEKVEQLALDVVLLDLTMPGMNGFEAAPIILERAPATKIVFSACIKFHLQADWWAHTGLCRRVPSSRTCWPCSNMFADWAEARPQPAEHPSRHATDS